MLSDGRLQLCIDGDSDVGYLELYSLSHKARAYGNAMGLRVPMVAPVKGIGPAFWAGRLSAALLPLAPPGKSLTLQGTQRRPRSLAGCPSMGFVRRQDLCWATTPFPLGQS